MNVKHLHPSIHPTPLSVNCCLYPAEGWLKVSRQHNQTVSSPLMAGYKWWCPLGDVGDIDAWFSSFTLWCHLFVLVLVARKAAPQLLCSVRSSLFHRLEGFMLTISPSITALTQGRACHFAGSTSVTYAGKQGCHRGRSFRPTADTHISSAIRLIWQIYNFYLWYTEYRLAVTLVMALRLKTVHVLTAGCRQSFAWSVVLSPSLNKTGQHAGTETWLCVFKWGLCSAWLNPTFAMKLTSELRSWEKGV